jgi:hypothetical protein
MGKVCPTCWVGLALGESDGMGQLVGPELYASGLHANLMH